MIALEVLVRVTDPRPNVAPRVDQSAGATSASPEQLGSLFDGVDLGWFPTAGDVCAVLGRAANALAALFSGSGGGQPVAMGTSTGDAGSIVDFGDKGDGGDVGSIVDFGHKAPLDRGDLGSIVDFGDQKPEDA